MQHRDAVGVDQPGPRIGVTPLRLVDHHDGAAGAQRDEHVHHRDVAFQGRQGQASIRGADLEVAADEFHGVHRGIVGDFDTLRLSGRPRGEQHVGELAGIDSRAGDLGVRGSTAQHVGKDQPGHRQRQLPRDRGAGRPRSADRRLIAQLRVAEVAGTGEHRGRIRLPLGLPKEPVVQGFSAGRRGAPVDRGALRLGQRRGTRRVPGVIGGGQPQQLVDVVGEHGVDHPGWEKPFPHIPIHQHAAVEFGDLGVEQHLRSLRDDPGRRAELAGDLRAEQFAESQRAGENHRRQHLGAAMTAQVAQHRQPRVGGMGGGRAHRVLHHLSARRRGVRADQVDVEQQRGGEVADQRVDVRVQGLPPEQRNIQQEAGIGRPAGQRVGEPRGQRHRRGDAAGGSGSSGRRRAHQSRSASRRGCGCASCASTAWRYCR